MKKLIVASLMALGIFTASAQKKIGFINIDELIRMMPETEKLYAELTDYRTSLILVGADVSIFIAKRGIKDIQKW